MDWQTLIQLNLNRPLLVQMAKDLVSFGMQKTALAGTMTGYLYDADGTRVAKGTITSWSCDPDTAGNGFQTTADYILGPGGEQGTEISVSVSGGGVTGVTGTAVVDANGVVTAVQLTPNAGFTSAPTITKVRTLSALASLFAVRRKKLSTCVMPQEKAARSCLAGSSGSMVKSFASSVAVTC